MLDLELACQSYGYGNLRMSVSVVEELVSLLYHQSCLCSDNRQHIASSPHQKGVLVYS